MVKEIETLSEDERHALRGSKFVPLSSLPRTSKSQPRSAHLGRPVTTNKAATLAKFLERKLKEPDGLACINHDLLELAVNNDKQTILGSSSNLERSVRHVDSFGDTDVEDEKNELSQVKECHTKFLVNSQMEDLRVIHPKPESSTPKTESQTQRLTSSKPGRKTTDSYAKKPPNQTWEEVLAKKDNKTQALEHDRALALSLIASSSQAINKQEYDLANAKFALELAQKRPPQVPTPLLVTPANNPLDTPYIAKLAQVQHVLQLEPEFFFGTPNEDLGAGYVAPSLEVVKWHSADKHLDDWLVSADLMTIL
ncbi:hypothetical protein K1719_027226 [Acacia pycnantha]|nr:hypothetical protein K1719_027226 [Acacia pycnantha]